MNIIKVKNVLYILTSEWGSSIERLCIQSAEKATRKIVQIQTIPRLKSEDEIA